MAQKIVNHQDLEVYQRAFDAAMVVFKLSKRFPKEEQYSMTDQIRRSSRSVCANLAEGWRRRRYEGAFIDKLSIAEAEVAETQVWLQFAVACEYCAADEARAIYQNYATIIATLVGMINHPDTWVIASKPQRKSSSKYRLDTDE